MKQPIPGASLSHLDLLIFDLDGTLIDSRKDIAGAFNWTVAAFDGAPVSPTELAAHLGIGVKPLLARAIPDATDEALIAFNHYYLEHMTDHTHLFNGVLEMLTEFSTYPKVILTNKERQFAEPLLEKLGLSEHFSECFARDAFPTHKPDPGPVIAIAKKFAAHRPLVIGDMAVDLLAGKRAGALTCAATYGYGVEAELRALKPTFIIAQPLDLIEVVANE